MAIVMNVDQTLAMKTYFQLFLEQAVESYFIENIE